MQDVFIQILFRHKTFFVSPDRRLSLMFLKIEDSLVHVVVSAAVLV